MLIALVVCGGAAAFMISAGYYPIAFVGNRPLLARDFWRNYRAAATYYENFARTYSASSTDIGYVVQATQTELERSVLEALIERRLVHVEAENEIGGNLQGLIEERIGKFENDGELQKAASAVYGLSAADFRREVLVPQAEREILTGQLFLKGEKIDNWLEKAKGSSNVVIFSPDFKWSGKGVELIKGED
jgi:hypothetical protein